MADALSKKGVEAAEEKEVLSRKGVEAEEDKEMRVVARPYWQDFQEVLGEVEENETLRRITEDIKRDPDSHPAFTLENIRVD